jgi:phosphoserine/homoserine phosphotransferase
LHLVCLDLEGVLVPEIWIAFSEATGISEFRITTRDEPDYNKLMSFRIDLLTKHKLKLKDIQSVIGSMEPLEGSCDFVQSLREKTQFIILSDTFEQFAKPLMAKLGYPTLLCNRLEIAPDGSVCGFRLRQQNGKKAAVTAFKTLNFKTFAAGDSFNDLAMIEEADSGCLFRAPETIRKDYAHLPCVDTYGELLQKIDGFLGDGERVPAANPPNSR